jgi:hypothetical protein
MKITMKNSFIQKILSGGQTGVDRAALDAAIKLGMPHGGWCPKTRLSEDGAIPLQYNLVETPSAVYAERTEWNARDSDGTLIIVKDEPTGGTAYTIEMAKKYGKPCLITYVHKPHQIEIATTWIRENNIRKLNVAGPRASQVIGIYEVAYQLIYELLLNLQSNNELI